MRVLLSFVKFLVICNVFVYLAECLNIFKYKLDSTEQKYGSFSERRRLEMLEEAKKMFYFAYENYMRYAFPKDELDPIHCTGRGPDRENP